VNILAFIFALEAGFQSSNELLYTAPDWNEGSLSAGYEMDSPYIQLEAAGELLDFFRVGGAAQIFMADTDNWQYAPYDARFTFYFQAHLAGFTAGWEHLCIHPIEAYGRPLIGWLYGGGDKLYLRYEAKIGVR
jgi:hypothetical protein